MTLLNARTTDVQRAESPSRRTPPRVASPTPSETPSELATFGNQEVLKALMRQIPDYNGSGGVPKLLEFIDKFEAFREESDLSPSMELQFAASKLTGDALIWWRQHKKEFPCSSSERIRMFTKFQEALEEQFTPPEYATTIHTKLRTLKQTSTV